MFETVQSVSGVGPRLALALVAVLSPSELSRAVQTEDLGALTSVPGIGKKGAQRLVLELAGKLPADLGGGAAPMTTDQPLGCDPSEPVWAAQVRDALEGLGWNTAQATKATRTVVEQHAQDTGPAPELPVLLREALREAAS